MTAKPRRNDCNCESYAKATQDPRCLLSSQVDARSHQGSKLSVPKGPGPWLPRTAGHISPRRFRFCPNALTQAIRASWRSLPQTTRFGVELHQAWSLPRVPRRSVQVIPPQGTRQERLYLSDRTIVFADRRCKLERPQIASGLVMKTLHPESVSVRSNANDITTVNQLELAFNGPQLSALC